MKGYQETFERKEQKYRVSRDQKESLLAIAGRHLQHGEYALGMVESIYFDTDRSSVICRSMEKPAYKEKLRLRRYQGCSECFVELKKKYKGIVYKRRICMTEDAAWNFLAGVPYLEAMQSHPLASPAAQAEALSARSIQIAREIEAFARRTQRAEGPLKPSMLISCEREALAGSADRGLRVTFDSDIEYTRLSEGGTDLPVSLLPYDQAILEIKALGSYPLWLARALDECNIRPCSFSKYGESYLHACSELAS